MPFPDRNLAPLVTAFCAADNSAHDHARSARTPHATCMLPALGWRVWFVRSTPSQAQCRALILRVSLADWALLLAVVVPSSLRFSRGLSSFRIRYYSHRRPDRGLPSRSGRPAKICTAMQCKAGRVPKRKPRLARNSGCVDVLTWIITLIRAIYRGR